MIRPLHTDPSHPDAGSMNKGIFLTRRNKDGLLCVKKVIPILRSAGQPLRLEDEAVLLEQLRRQQCPYINDFIHRSGGPMLRTGPSINLYTRYCDRGTLQSLIDAYNARRRAIPELFVWHVCDNIGKALAFLHFGVIETTSTPVHPLFSYIVHGDLKPANIFLRSHAGRYPVAVLGDFGGAVTRNELDGQYARTRERHGHVVTPGFMAPEAEKAFGPKADVWGLALTLLEMCGAEINEGIRQRDEIARRLDRTAYSGHMKHIITAASRKNHEDRWDSKNLVENLTRRRKIAVTAGFIPDSHQAQPLSDWACPSSST
ncbi:MAG: hypothetical protein M1831_003680 [Alyxoria varia]|nr:MAG: hypothetical protein M1831_003680 [Alyxoria varia]